MSQIKKSASFRCRSSLVKSRIPQRLGSSPQLQRKVRHRKASKLSYDNYSTSSFSSGDESNDSDNPIKKSFVSSPLKPEQVFILSTDEMSLSGLLDSISIGSSSTSQSPKNHQTTAATVPTTTTFQDGRKTISPSHLSSFESLDHFNGTNETLKINDDYIQKRNNILNTNNRAVPATVCDILSSMATQYHHDSSSPANNNDSMKKHRMVIENENNKNSVLINGNNSIEKKRSENYSHTNLNDDELSALKQKLLSDVYYIKTSPKPKPTSPFERRRMRNLKPGNSSTLSSRNSSDDLNLISAEPLYNPLQKYRSNDLIEHQKQSSIHSNEDKSSLQSTYKCFSMKYSRNPAGRRDDEPAAATTTTTRFGEMPSTSFEHVNVARLCSDNVLKDDDDDYVRSLRLAAAKLKPSSPQHISLKEDSQHFPMKSTKNAIATTPSSYRTELSGSFASLPSCPPPPDPPNLSEKHKDPQVRLAIYLKSLYIDLSLKELILPQWAQPVAPGVLCSDSLEVELRFSSSSHGLNECLTVDQILSAVQTKEGAFIEAPRRVLIECPAWLSKSSLALRVLKSWAREPVWPPRGEAPPIALGFYVPSHEVKGSLQKYITRELLTKCPSNPFFNSFGAYNSTWSSIETLKGKLLFILDVTDSTLNSSSENSKNHRKSKGSTCDDIIDLLEGRLFPECRVVLLASSSQCSDLLPFTQRHLRYEGLTWGRSVSLLGGGQWGASTRLLDFVQASTHLRCVARTPLGCLAIALLHKTNGGQLPSEEIDVIESIITCVAPNFPPSHIAELGRLTLFCLKARKSSFNGENLRMYCSQPHSPLMGCFEKCPAIGKTARKKGDMTYIPICQGIFEYFAARYLVSLANRPGLLAAEITGLSIVDEIDSYVLKVLKYSMTLLGNRAHVLLSKLSTLWLSPQTVFSLALAGGDTDANLNALSDMLGISKVPPISPLETNPIWVSISSSISELQGWGLALKSPVCALKNLELMYQVEKTVQVASRNAMDIFLDALSRNESVTTLRISSLIENDVRESEMNHLATCISKALLKPRLESFELILTLLEEDPPPMKLQSVVSALCKSIPRQTKLTSILLDLGLCTSQLVQICSALEKCPHINRLSLPHLRCDRGAIATLSSLLRKRPLSSLALPACWGARDDPPSSSGVSMGSGSGSSSGNSGLIKQNSLSGGVPSPRAYFSSLPRGVPLVSTLGRSQTLPRQLLEGPADKRSQDSVISRNWYPTPTCDGGPHNSGTLHELFAAIREPYSRLHGLDLSKAQLSLEDAMCLGEAVRVSSTLHSIHYEGASRLTEVLPTVLGASESPCLQMLSLGSPRLVLEDTAIMMTARSLASCITLRLLSLDGWSFKFENVMTIGQVSAFLALTSVRELGLSSCRIYLPMFNNNATAAGSSSMQMPYEAYECRSVVVLKLNGTQVILGDQIPMRGPQLLPYLEGFTNLRDLDLSAPARSGLGTSTSAPPLILDDKSLITFFQQITQKFRLLNTLKICNWIIHLDDAARTFKAISKALKSSTISHVKIDGVSVLDRAKKSRIEPQFLHCLLSSYPVLRWISVSLSGASEEQMTFIGNSIGDIKSNEIDIRLSDSSIDNVRLMTQSMNVDGKFDIRVSTFGTSSNILVHVEKIGVKSLSRKQKF